MARVPFLLELMGPPCEVPDCKGVLVDTVDLKTRTFFRRCSVCGKNFHHASVEEKFAWAKRTLARVLKGEKTS